MSDRDGWTAIRVRRSTLKELEDYRMRLVRSYQRGLLRHEHGQNFADERQRPGEDEAQPALGLDAIICRLLAQLRRHGERRRRQASKRRNTDKVCIVTAPSFGAGSPGGPSDPAGRGPWPPWRAAWERVRVNG